MKAKLEKCILNVLLTVESRFFEYSIIRNSRFFEPKVVSLGFASAKHCNFTGDFSKLPIFRTNSFFIRIRLNLDKHLRIKISDKSLTQRFDVSMTSLSSGENKI